LALLARRAATEQPDLIAALAAAVKGAVASDVDPYLLMGTLIEGVAHTLASIQPKRQPDTTRAAVVLLVDRLGAGPLLSMARIMSDENPVEMRKCARGYLELARTIERETATPDAAVAFRHLAFAVGTPIAERPPHRSVQAEFPHTAPTLGV